jgi:hypothetical protein
LISITRKTLGVLVIKPAKGGAQLSVNASGSPAQIKVRLDIARQGPAGPPANVIPTWNYYAINWTTPPAQLGTTAAGAVYGYTLSGTTRYRLVPSPYAASQDAFYSAWDGITLSGLIVARGI